MRVEGEVLGSIRTLKDQRVLDLLGQLVEEVVPGGVLVQQAAGVPAPLALLKPAQEQGARVRRWNRSRPTTAEVFLSVT